MFHACGSAWPLSISASASSAWGQPGERRLQLVRGVGRKWRWVANRLIQPRQQIVDRRHQRRYLFGTWRCSIGDRSVLSRSGCAAQLGQRRMRAPAQPQQQHGAQDHELAAGSRPDALGGQRDLSPASAISRAKRVAIASRRLSTVGHAHRLSGHVVAQTQLGAGSGFGPAGARSASPASSPPARAKHWKTGCRCIRRSNWVARGRDRAWRSPARHRLQLVPRACRTVEGRTSRTPITVVMSRRHEWPATDSSPVEAASDSSAISTRPPPVLRPDDNDNCSSGAWRARRDDRRRRRSAPAGRNRCSTERVSATNVIREEPVRVA